MILKQLDELLGAPQLPLEQSVPASHVGRRCARACVERHLADECDPNFHAESLVDERALSCMAVNDEVLHRANATGGASSTAATPAPDLSAPHPPSTEPPLPRSWASVCHRAGDGCPCNAGGAMSRCDASASCRRRMGVLFAAAHQSRVPTSMWRGPKWTRLLALSYGEQLVSV